MVRQGYLRVLPAVAVAAAGFGLLSAGCSKGGAGSGTENSAASQASARPNGRKVAMHGNVSPQVLASRIDDRILNNRHMSGANVRAVVDKDGIATLIGYVLTPEQRARAVVSAWNTLGIHGVNSQLEIRPSSDPFSASRQASNRHGRGGYATMSLSSHDGGSDEDDDLDDTSSDDSGNTAYASASGNGSNFGGQTMIAGYDAASASRIDPNSPDDSDTDDTDMPADQTTEIPVTVDENGNPTVASTDAPTYIGAPGNTVITKLGRSPGVIPQNAGSYLAGTHSTLPR